MSGDDVGSVEEESRLLVEALRRVQAVGAGKDVGSASSPLRLVTDDTDAGEGAGHHEHGEVPEGSASCPWCRTQAWRREHGPQLLRGLADVAALAADGLRTMAAAWEATATGQEPDQHEDADGRSGPDCGTGSEVGGRGSLLHPSPNASSGVPGEDEHDDGRDERQERA